MSWSRAVWTEKGKTIEGVLSSNWIQNKYVYWPKKNAQSCANNHEEPTEEWLKFPLVKIKYTGGMIFCNILPYNRLTQIIFSEFGKTLKVAIKFSASIIKVSN